MSEGAMTDLDRILHLFACDCAEKVLHIANDYRSENAVAVARRFAHSLATAEELGVANKEAWNAVADYEAAHGDDGGDAAVLNTRLAAAAGTVWQGEAASRAEACSMYAAFSIGWHDRTITYGDMRDAQLKRLLQYIKHGDTAEQMKWPD